MAHPVMAHAVVVRRPGALRIAGPLASAAAIATLVTALLAAPAASALEEQKGEAAAIEACDKRLCAILVEKNPQGADLKCALTKTWARRSIKEAESQQLSWGFGDARCSVEINLSRERLVEVLTSAHTTFHAGRYTASCVVEQDGKLEKVTAVVAPKIEFRNGKADKVWVRLKSIDGPAAITGTVQTAASLADTFGLFHARMIKNINRYIERHCPKVLDVAAAPAKAKANDKADKQATGADSK